MRLKAKLALNSFIYRKLIFAGLILILNMSVLAAEKPRLGPSVDFSHGDLKVSDNKRFIVHADGTPFFYLADTAWELFHRLNSKEAERYLENRLGKEVS